MKGYDQIAARPTLRQSRTCSLGRADVFSLQPRPSFGSLPSVRCLPAIALFLGLLCPGFAQEQENHLMNRLLRPSASQANSAQNKKFTADRASIDKRARIGTFYLQRKSMTRTYVNTRDFQAGSFKAGSFNSSGSGNSLLAARSNLQTHSYATPTARASVELRDGHKAAAASTGFAGNRPFLDQGKSQKSLDHLKSPMTIEQVRELLNKNK